MQPKSLTRLSIAFMSLAVPVLHATAFGQATRRAETPPSTSQPAIRGTLDKAIVAGITQQIPELAIFGAIKSGASSPTESWKGEEFISAAFVWTKDAGADPRARGRQGIPLLAMKVSIHRYASAADAEKDLESGVALRPATPSEGPYRNATLVRYGDGGTIICRSGAYIVEISSPQPSLVMKALDAVLDQLDQNSDTRK